MVGYMATEGIPKIPHTTAPRGPPSTGKSAEAVPPNWNPPAKPKPPILCETQPPTLPKGRVPHSTPPEGGWPEVPVLAPTIKAPRWSEIDEDESWMPTSPWFPTPVPAPETPNYLPPAPELDEEFDGEAPTRAVYTEVDKRTRFAPEWFVQQPVVDWSLGDPNAHLVAQAMQDDGE